MSVKKIVYSNEKQWNEGLQELKSGAIVEMCEESYDHFLGCTPPMVQRGGSYVSGEPYKHNEQGRAVYLCGLSRHGKFYAQYGTVNDFKTRKLFKF